MRSNYYRDEFPLMKIESKPSKYDLTELEQRIAQLEQQMLRLTGRLGPDRHLGGVED